MKKIGIVIFLMLALAVLYSCQEYEMVQYGAGQQINFMGDYYLGQNKEPYWEDDTAYLHYEVNFGINPLGDSLRADKMHWKFYFRKHIMYLPIPDRLCLKYF